VKLNRREIDGVVILELEGKVLGGEDSEPLRRAFEEALQEPRPRILLNLAGVGWLNSAGLGVLLSGYLRVRDAGGEMKFLNVQERVRGILITTKLVRVLEVFNNEEKALASFTGKGTEPAERT